MGRGGTPYLSYTGLALVASLSTASAGLWDVDIDLSPAPSPGDGPPFSAHATRNKALLPYQIIGIVGAYVGTALIISTLLFTVGRRLRKRAQTMAERPIEMVKPMNRAFSASHFGAPSFSGWGQKLRSKKSMSESVRSTNEGTSDVGSPVAESIVSFDQHVLNEHKQRDDEQMAELYQAFYNLEDQRSRQDVIPTGAQQASPPQYSRTRPPPLTVSGTDLKAAQPTDFYAQSPMTPKSPVVHAIYPPTQYTGNTGTSTPDRGSGSATGRLRKAILRKSIKEMKISAPIQSMRKDDNSDGARTPLSPRFYINPGVPPAPPTTRTVDSQFPLMHTPGTARSAAFSEMQDYEDEQADEIGELPQVNPQRLNDPKYEDANMASPSKRSVANMNNPLPFRQNNYTQQRNAFPASPIGDWNLHVPRSPGPMSSAMKSPSIRERVVEVGSGNRLGVPFTGCATPYSPYMPYTPVTPMTAHLETRAERKQRQRDERATRGAITEADQVADDKDLWASGY